MTEEATTETGSGGGETPAAVTPAATGTPAAAPATPDVPAEQTVPLPRLQAVIAQRAEIQRANEALQRELKLAQDTIEEFKAVSSKSAANGADATAKPVPKGPSPAELQQLVREEAARQNFDQRCNDAAAAGKAAHNDFDKVVLGDLTSVSPVLDNRTGRPVLPVALLEAALETGSAHEVLYALGQDIAEATRIMSLRPVAQAVEIAKFAQKVSAKAEAAAEPEVDEENKPVLKNVSKAPAPIKPPTKGGPVKPSFTIYDTEHFSTEEWIRQREKQVADARANGRR